MPKQDSFFRFHVMESLCYDETGGYLYLNNAKSGCSTVRSTLIGSMPTAKRAHMASLPHGGDIHTNGWWDWNLQDLGERRPYTFTVVRNPFTRALSAWLDKIRGTTLQKHQFCQSVGLDVDGDVSFRDFLAALDPGATIMDKHWRPQANNVYARSLDIDDVFHLENFDANAGALAERLELESGFTTRKPHATGASNKVREHYCDETIERVRRIYAEDFELFGYSSDIADVDDAPARPLSLGNEDAGAMTTLALIGLSLSDPEARTAERFSALVADAKHPPSVYDRVMLAQIGAFDADGKRGLETSLEACLDASPSAGERLVILDLLTGYRLQRKELDVAADGFDTLCRLAPYIVRFHVRRIETLVAAGRVDEAATRLEQLRRQTWNEGRLAELDALVSEGRTKAA